MLNFIMKLFTMKLTKILLLILSVVLFTGCGDDDNPKSSEKQIIEFSVNNLEAIIDQSAKTITLALPTGSDLSKIKPTVKVSDKASVNPASGAEQDFNNPIKYTVTAEDGTQQEYMVTLTVAKSSDKDILRFYIIHGSKNIPGDVNHETNIISVEVPAETDVTKLKALVNISSGATVSPASETEQDFTDPVIYTVTAQDGSKQEYIVIVKDKIANADPHLVITLRIGEDRDRPYRRLKYDSPERRLVHYTETAAEHPGEERNMDVIQIVYEDDKVIKIMRIEDAETTMEQTRTLDVTYPDHKTIHITEQLTGTTTKTDIITLNDAGKVSKFVQDSESETFEYDKAGNLIKLTGTDGEYKVITYDNKNGIFKYGNTPQWIWLYTIGRLIGIGPNNYISIKTYTAGGQLIETSDYRYVYDPISWYPNAYKKENDKYWTGLFYTSM